MNPWIHQEEANLIYFNKMTIELKVASKLADEHRPQLLYYRQATGMKVGLLVNFHRPNKMEHERFVL